MGKRSSLTLNEGQKLTIASDMKKIQEPWTLDQINNAILARYSEKVDIKAYEDKRQLSRSEAGHTADYLVKRGLWKKEKTADGQNLYSSK